MIIVVVTLHAFMVTNDLWVGHTMLHSCRTVPAIATNTGCRITNVTFPRVGAGGFVAARESVEMYVRVAMAIIGTSFASKWTMFTCCFGAIVTYSSR